MKLRKPCEHGHYEEHTDIPERDPADPIGTIRGPFFPCPGGVFLPDDAIVIEMVDGQWPEPLRRFAEWVIQYTADTKESS